MAERKLLGYPTKHDKKQRKYFENEITLGDDVKTILLRDIFFTLFIYMHAGIIKTTVILDITMIKARFHLLEAIKQFAVKKLCRQRNEYTSFVAIFELYGEWRQT